MNNPQFLTIFTIVFILLGCYNIYTGLKRLRQAQARGQKIVWYQQITLLTGIEYLLLSFVFLMSININNHTLPSSLKSIVVPFYLITLLCSAVLAGFVIRQGIVNARRTSQKSISQPSRNNVGSQTYELTGPDDKTSLKQKTISVQHRRERRQKAAAARRRHSGKA